MQKNESPQVIRSARCSAVCPRPAVKTAPGISTVEMLHAEGRHVHVRNARKREFLTWK